MVMMAAASLKSEGTPSRPQGRAQDIDRYVGSRMRERRIMLALTQQQMAELIGVTYQQAHKYEKGINRIAAGRLFSIAQALGVEVGYFFDGMGRERNFKPTPQQRMLLEFARNFINMPSRKHQEAMCSLARALSTPELRDDKDQHQHQHAGAAVLAEGRSKKAA
jgi:transcriptional regulator with XRE-family HTH domain